MKTLKAFFFPILIVFGTIFVLVAGIVTAPQQQPQDTQIPQESVMPAPQPVTPQEEDQVVTLEPEQEIVLSPMPENDDAAIEGDETVAIAIPPLLDGMDKPPEDINQPQKLRSEPLIFKLSDGQAVNFVVEIAVDKVEKIKGLMFRDEVPDNTGMLFLFDDSRERKFWMKNTFVPLDIIFIKSDGTIHKIHDSAVPSDLTPVKSGEPVPVVLEIRGGEAARLGIKEGDKILSEAFSQHIQTYNLQ